MFARVATWSAANLGSMFGVKSLSATLRKVFLPPAQLPNSDENQAELILGLK